MAITVPCPKCGTSLRAPDTAVGKKVKCPKCATVLTVSTAEKTLAEEFSEDIPMPAPRPRSPQTTLPPSYEDEETNAERTTSGQRERAAPPARRIVNGLGIAAMVVGSGALVVSLIPCCLGFLSLPFSILGLVLGIVGLLVAVIGGRWGLVSPIAGSLISLLAIVMPFGMAFLMVHLGKSPYLKLTRADNLYDQGKHAEAVAKYKENFNFATDRPKVLRRIVEEEIQAGHMAEARTWIEKGIDQGVAVTYDSPAARDLAATVAKEHAQVPSFPGARDRETKPLPEAKTGATSSKAVPSTSPATTQAGTSKGKPRQTSSEK